ncbi:MAG: M20 family metallopeptidase [Nitrososphaeria archaeon]
MSEERFLERKSIEILRSLIRIPSVNPHKPGGRGEKEISEFIYDELRSNGIRVELQQVENGRNNVVAFIGGRMNGPVLILNGHMDTVGVENMQIDPFSAYEDGEGRIYGRGASDMKGGLAAIIAAAESVVDQEDRIKGRVIISAVVDEEYLGMGTAKFAEKYRGDAAVVAEPTELKIGVAHKGMVWFRVRTRGKAAHGSVPELGVDAIRMMCSFINVMYSYKFSSFHPLLGSPKIHTSMIEGGSEWSKVPDTCVLSAERRILPGESWETVRRELEEMALMASSGGIQFSGDFELVHEFPPLEIDKSHYVVRKLKEATETVLGSSQDLVGLPYWTDGATLSRHGTPSTVFGPGSINVAHAPVEYVSSEEVVKASRVLRNLILSWGT